MIGSAALAAVFTRFFPAERALCPKCGKLLRRVTAGTGSLYVTCDNKLDNKLMNESRRCGQTAHLLALEGVVAVTPVSKAQFRLFAASYAPARVVYAELGIVSEPLSEPRSEGRDAGACQSE